MNRLTARQRRNLGESLSGYSFILPQMLGFILFVLVPLVNVFIYSFQNKNMLFGTSVEEHILCHKGAYTGKSGITRDMTGKPWYYRSLKR